MADTPESNSASIRHDLVETAAKFLISAKVAASADSAKEAFLTKKGLTKEEITAAFQRAKTLASSQPPSQIATVPGAPQYAQQHQIVQYQPPPKTVWGTIRDISNLAVFIAGVSYGIHYVYKHYIRPRITGRRPKTVDESIAELQGSVVGVLKEVQASLSSIERVLSSHSNSMAALTASSPQHSSATGQQVSDLKSEVMSMKALLINRKAFPSTPVISHSSSTIPHWQRSSLTASTNGQQKSETNTATDSDSSTRSDEATKESRNDSKAKELPANNGDLADSDTLKPGDIISGSGLDAPFVKEANSAAESVSVSSEDISQ